jgi:hypothetical protein
MRDFFLAPLEKGGWGDQTVSRSGNLPPRPLFKMEKHPQIHL